MNRPRIKKSRNYDLCDARLGVQNMYVIFIHATGRQVIVAGSSPEVAVSTLITWLHYRGLDSRVMLLQSYEANDVLSATDLMYQSELMRNDPSIF